MLLKLKKISETWLANDAIAGKKNEGTTMAERYLLTIIFLKEWKVSYIIMISLLY